MEFSVSTTRGQHLLGKVVGDCILEKLIGYGGTSAVFLAQPRNAEQKVAVKVFLPRSTMDSQAQKGFYRRFLREAQAASNLDHPHILSVYSYGEHQGLPYIVMPYIPGGTLADYVRREGPLSLRVAQSYLKQIADALDYAHKNRLVHRDVKPANIFVDSYNRVTLTDFGIAKALDRSSSTLTGTVIGTPTYMSPEQAMGIAVDHRADIYALGIVAFELIGGRLPYVGTTPYAVVQQHLEAPPPSIAAVLPGAPPRLDAAIRRALAKQPAERGGQEVDDDHRGDRPGDHPVQHAVEPRRDAGEPGGHEATSPERDQGADEPPDAGADAQAAGVRRGAGLGADEPEPDSDAEDAEHQLDREGDEDGGEQRRPGDAAVDVATVIGKRRLGDASMALRAISIGGVGHGLGSQGAGAANAAQVAVVRRGFGLSAGRGGIPRRSAGWYASVAPSPAGIRGLSRSDASALKLLLHRVANAILDTPNGVLRLAGCLFGRALGLCLGVARDLANGLLHGTLRLLRRTLDAILVHGSTFHKS